MKTLFASFVLCLATAAFAAEISRPASASSAPKVPVPSIQDLAKFSPEQQSKLELLNQEEKKAIQNVTDDKSLDAKTKMEKTWELRSSYIKKRNALLTPEQRDRLKAWSAKKKEEANARKTEPSKK